MVELLLSLILLVTGVDRSVDPVLVEDANRRVVEIQKDFSHNGQAYPEILHWNQGYENPIHISIAEFRASPGHWAIMSNPAYTRIGCAVAVDQSAITWVACVFAEPVVQLPPVEEPILLPNTAMEDE